MLAVFLIPAGHEGLNLKYLQKYNVHNNKLQNWPLGFDKVL